MQRVFNILITLAIIGLGVITLPDHFKSNSPPVYQAKDIVRLEQPEFLLSEEPDSALLVEALKYYDVKHPEIVYAQAILETGHFKSRVCKEYNNLFGLYDSKKGEYYKFNHWSESVVGYLNYIQNRYHPSNDYYIFLKDIRYAEDSMYVHKLKGIIN